jgi:hypothetical protein
MVVRIFQMERDDAMALQRLGAAVVLQWATMPAPLQESLVQQALAIDGDPNAAAIARRIRELATQKPYPDTR